MIISSDYDKSLCLMIYGDGINRDKLSLVIKNMSFEFLDNIQELVRQYNVDNITRNISYEMDNLRYEVCIDNFELSIKMIREIDGIFNEIELFILPYDEEYINQMKLGSKLSLGGFGCRKYTNNMDFGTTLDEYELVKTMFGKCIKLYIDNKVKAINKQRVNLRKVPNDFNVMDVRSKSGIKRLVRQMK